jgi:integrase
MAAIYRRGKTYWARAQRKGREHRRSLKTTNRGIAERRLREWLGELDAIQWGDKPRRSWEEAAAKFILEHFPAIKPSSRQRYKVSMTHLNNHFAGKMMHQVTSAEMSDFETKRRMEGVSTSTIRRDLACLSSLVTSTVEWEWQDANPVPAYLKRRSKRGLKEGNARTRYFTDDEERRLIAAATSRGSRTKNGRQTGKPTCAREAIILAIDSGLRREELFALTWRQVDLIRGLIDTRTKTKSGRMRKVPLPPRSAQILAQLPRHDSGFVFVNPDAGTRYVQMDKGFKAAARRAEIEDARWHDLRRTAGCRWLQRDGKSLEEVSILLGHSSVKVTEKCYAFLEAEMVAESLSRTKTGTSDSGVVQFQKVGQ